ncbi:MAG: FAD-dependent oxidoreductase [Deltaproteobacteria bacterium]|nr:FAD-dependent oxidoreductase [Deltaproteobacteria bacterium]
MSYPHVFSPYRLRNLVFKNRIFAAPVTANRIALGGAPTAEGIDAYETRARGGFAQVTVTETFVDFELAARHGHGLDLVSPRLSTHHLESIAILAEAIKAHGAVASIQFNHAGNVNHPDALGGRSPIGPCRLVRPDGVVVDEMDEAMIDRVAGHFANACGAAKALGFDMAMLHGAHGWLLAQFASPLSNRRTDRWGGSLENRARFARLVLEKVRAEVGEDFVLEYRVSGDERVEGGMHLEETVEFCRLIEDRVDLIHVTSGVYYNHVESKAFSSMFDPHGCNVDLAAAIKAAVKVPVVAVGGFTDPALAEQVLAEGKCDFVALGRQVLADPDWVRKALTGRADEIAPCLRCSCFNPLASSTAARPVPKLWTCTVNPRSNRELRLRQAPRPAASRKVLVVGGGVSGMYAALTAAERGHRVTLAEKEGVLGGILWMTEVDSHKADLKRFKDSLITRLGRLGVRVELETEVTADSIRLQEPDAVICAVGSELIVPPIPGIEKARPVWDAYRDFDGLGRRIVMIGGGLIGSETGFWLAENGKTVHLVELLDDVAKEGNDSHRRALLPRMRNWLTWDVETTCVEVRGDGVRVADKAGRERFIEADTVVYATGLRSKTPVVESLRGSAPWFVATGDCVRPRKVEQAVYEGFMAAMDIL